MSSFPNYNLQFPYMRPQYWINQYYQIGYCQNNLPFYNTPAYNPYYSYHHMGICPTSDNFSQQKKNDKQVIKLQEERPVNLNLRDQKQVPKEKIAPKVTKRRGFLPKLSEVDKNIYVHPPKQVSHRVKYFDPCSAPVVSSTPYNLIEDLQKQQERCQLIQNLNEENPNELLFPEQDNLPFIVFKHRRIKKKFKKYIKPKDQFLYGQKSHDEDSDNRSDYSSQLSQEDSDDESYSQNEDKGYKKRKTIVKKSFQQKQKPPRDQQVLNIQSSSIKKSQN